MHDHGWLDYGGNGQAVCPGDFIVTTNGRHIVVQQPGRAEATDRAQQAQDMKDAARYRWPRNNPQWIGFDSDYRPDQIDAAIDKAMMRNAQDGMGRFDVAHPTNNGE